MTGTDVWAKGYYEKLADLSGPFLEGVEL